MTTNQHPSYDAQFPETFNWQLIDSPKLAALAEQIVRAIKYDLETETRQKVSGLRYALNEIAKLSQL